MGIVDQLEAIQVEQCDADRAALRLLAFALGQFQEAATVVDAGQPVGAGQFVQALVRGQQLTRMRIDLPLQLGCLPPEIECAQVHQQGHQRHQQEGGDDPAERGFVPARLDRERKVGLDRVRLQAAGGGAQAQPVVALRQAGVDGAGQVALGNGGPVLVEAVHAIAVGGLHRRLIVEQGEVQAQVAVAPVQPDLHVAGRELAERHRHAVDHGIGDCQWRGGARQRLPVRADHCQPAQPAEQQLAAGRACRGDVDVAGDVQAVAGAEVGHLVRIAVDPGHAVGQAGPEPAAVVGQHRVDLVAGQALRQAYRLEFPRFAIGRRIGHAQPAECADPHLPMRAAADRTDQVLRQAGGLVGAVAQVDEAARQAVAAGDAEAAAGAVPPVVAHLCDVPHGVAGQAGRIVRHVAGVFQHAGADVVAVDAVVGADDEARAIRLQAQHRLVVQRRQHRVLDRQRIRVDPRQPLGADPDRTVGGFGEAAHVALRLAAVQMKVAHAAGLEVDHVDVAGAEAEPDPPARVDEDAVHVGVGQRVLFQRRRQQRERGACLRIVVGDAQVGGCPDISRAVAQQGAHRIAGQGRGHRRVVVDPLRTCLAGRVLEHAAAIGGDPYLAGTGLQEVAHGRVACAVRVAAEARHAVPAAVGIPVRRAGLAAAGPQAAFAILHDRPDLVVEHRGGELVRCRGPHEGIRACAADEQAAVVAQPQVAVPVLHHAEVARRGIRSGVHPPDPAGAQVEVVQSFLRGDPDAAGVIVAQREDLAVGEPAGADRIDMEAVVRRFEPDQAAGIGADQQAAVRQREQAAHVGVGQAGDLAAAGTKHLHAIAVVAHQAAHGADPDQAIAVLRDRGGDRMRQAVGNADLVEPGRVERSPGIAAAGAGRRAQEEQQEQAGKTQAETAATEARAGHASRNLPGRRAPAQPVAIIHAEGNCPLAFTYVLPPGGALRAKHRCVAGSYRQSAAAR